MTQRDAYSSRSWRKLRLAILDRDGWVCQVQLPVCIEAATHVDHIKALAEGGAAMDPMNLRAACAPCNSSLAGQLVAKRYGPYNPGRRSRKRIDDVPDPNRWWGNDEPHTERW